MSELYKGYRIDTARASWHDYHVGAYHVVLCTRDRVHYLGHIEGDVISSEMILSEVGKIAERDILSLKEHLPWMKVVTYTIMPNHIHMLVVVGDEAKKLSTVVGSLKSGIKRKANQQHLPLEWQTRYYDTIITSRKQWEATCEYISKNVAKWRLDTLMDASM